MAMTLTEKVCSICRTSKGCDQFAFQNKAYGVRMSACKQCRNAQKRADPQVKARAAAQRKADPDYNKKHRAWKHGLSVEDAEGMLWLQDNKCLGCGAADPTHTDHDHNHCPGSSGCVKCVRGFLCGHCNTTLGYARDNVQTLRNLADYLERG
jgi:hypothetical protein